MSEAAELWGCGVSRESLEGRTIRLLNRGSWANADVLLVNGNGGPVVVKDFAPRGRWVRAWLAPWLCRREVRAWRQLGGHPSVPRFLGSLDGLAFALEYRPGTRLSRSLAARLPRNFVDDLDAAVDDMHSRGVAHLDLRHRGNVLADAEGRPVLIDFGSTLVFEPGGRAARWLLPWITWIDHRAVRKWEIRLRPQVSD